MRHILVSLAFLLTACGSVDYENLPAGRFDGTLFVMWVGEGDDTAGAGRFVYVPMPNDPLVFRRGGAGGTLSEIRPQMMYTDGGSIPRPLQPFRGLSPWGYAPGYMVHDWLFLAKNCAEAGQANAEEAKVADMPFLESAEVLGEAIRTLIAERRVAPDDVAPRAISGAVAGPLSRRLWGRAEACPVPRVTDEHRAQVERALGRFQATPSGRLREREAPAGDAAGIVSIVRF